ncbi:ZIP family metal transporter [Parablastomonas sp. CN1-191]|uniref:ZIP family metal transporter n=1 Tax=Parablastomonas sp. CN1-191 TaxID=3400908 RepID=UPI003BF90683
MPILAFAFVPVFAVLLGAIYAVWRRPGPALEGAVQHLAAGVVFGAAAAEILPQVKHDASVWTTLIGGTLGVATMLGVKSLEGRWKGPIGMITAIGIDLVVDGLVLGLAFLGGAKAGVLMTIALTLEVLFLGLTVTAKLGEALASRFRVVALSVGLALLLPAGVLVATPVVLLPPHVIGGFLTFGLMALLYLVTEELLVEAHEKPDSPIISAMFFVGFLGLLIVEELMA